VISLLEAEQFELPFMRTTHPVKAEGHDQNARILAHLQSGRTLTALEALEWFKCFRLASRVCDLRKAGHDVQKRTIKTNSGKSVVNVGDIVSILLEQLKTTPCLNKESK
jgi:hypothetical protein